MALSAAELMLRQMKARGVDCLFGNAGTDFPPLIEAFARAAESGLDLPRPVLVSHETVATGMAHGYALATGRAQCIMVHVNVGLANAVMGALNAAADRVPMLLASGRTPVTEDGRQGSRSRPIHWGQEMRDQAAMVREAVKWEHELRYPEQAAAVVERALAIAHSDPPGPVYLSLPREVLAETVADGAGDAARQVPARSGMPSADAVAAAAALIAAASRPLIVAQRSPARDDFAPLADFAERFAIPVVDFWPSEAVMPTGHPMHGGSDLAPWIGEADLVIAVESMVPWMQAAGPVPPKEAKVIAIGRDPLFSGVPVRGFAADATLAGDPALALDALAAALAPHAEASRDALAARRDAIARRTLARRAAALDRARQGGAAPMSVGFASLTLSEAIGTDAVVFSELGCDPAAMRFTRPGSFYNAPISGGLGWGVPAALGLKLAGPERLVVACVGDGSYIFANPVACQLTAIAEGLPILVVVFNNARWQAVRRATLAMYPDGHAARSNAMPFTELRPSPDFAAMARAQGWFGERVEDGATLAAALERALTAVRAGRQPALLDLAVLPA